jgi:hypothetical protein
MGHRLQSEAAFVSLWQDVLQSFFPCLVHFVCPPLLPSVVFFNVRWLILLNPIWQWLELRAECAAQIHGHLLEIRGQGAGLGRKP